MALYRYRGLLNRETMTFCDDGLGGVSLETVVASFACPVEIQEEETSLKELLPSDWLEVMTRAGGIFLITDWCKRAQPTVGSTIP